MSPVKGSGSVGVSGNISSVKPQSSVPSGKPDRFNRFEKILGSKTGEAKTLGETAQPAAPTAEEVKERLRALVEGGASPDEVVRTALAGNPLVDHLSTRLKQRLVKNVAAVLSPTFQEKSLKRL